MTRKQLIISVMYLRRYGKKVDGEEYGYWSLVESVRTARGPRQRVVATIGKLPDFDKEERVGWEEIGRILTGKPQPQDSLFEKTEEPPSRAIVNINRVSVERLLFMQLSCASSVAPARFCANSVKHRCLTEGSRPKDDMEAVYSVDRSGRCLQNGKA